MLIEKQPHSVIYLSPYNLEYLAEIFSDVEFEIHDLRCSNGDYFHEEYISTIPKRATERVKHLSEPKVTFKTILETVRKLKGYRIIEYDFISDGLSIQNGTIFTENALISFYSKECKDLYFTKVVQTWNKDDRYSYAELNKLKPEVLYHFSNGKFKKLCSAESFHSLGYNLTTIENEFAENHDWGGEEQFYKSTSFDLKDFTG